MQTPTAIIVIILYRIPNTQSQKKVLSLLLLHGSKEDRLYCK